MAYTIGQASAKLNISIDTIRYYDKQGLLPFVSRTKNGRRSFTENDLHLMRTIICLVNYSVIYGRVVHRLNCCYINGLCQFTSRS